MYNIVKNVINKGGFDLSALLHKINTLWVQDDLSDEQKNELFELAREGADKKYSVEVLSKIEELDRRITALEKAGAGELPAVEYPDFVVGKWYYAGDTCTFERKKYICIAPDGVACVWSPADYPTYWKETE